MIDWTPRADRPPSTWGTCPAGPTHRGDRRHRRRAPRRLGWAVPLLAGLLVLGAHVPDAQSEGSAELGLEQGLFGGQAEPSGTPNPRTELFVDIIEPDRETVVWDGQGSVEVLRPDDSSFGTFDPGEEIDVDEAGAWEIVLSRNQFDGTANSISARYEWDVSVLVDGEPTTGRLWSTFWNVASGGFADDLAANTSFYAPVADGAAVVELKVEGLAGGVYQVFASSRGQLAGQDFGAGHSVAVTSGSIVRELHLYLNVPARADYTLEAPEVSDFTFTNGSTDCSVFSESEPGTFSFQASTGGNFHLVCDLSRDGLFDLVSGHDLVLIGDAQAGVNTFEWDGLDNTGDPVLPADLVDGDPHLVDNPPALSCMLRVTTGEFHHVSIDMETSYPGIRLYQVLPAGSTQANCATGELVNLRCPLNMHWNDTLVQTEQVIELGGSPALAGGAQPMRPVAGDGQPMFGAETSGSAGVNSGPYDDATVPHRQEEQDTDTPTLHPGNARAWGNFFCDPPTPEGCTRPIAPEADRSDGNGKGNNTLLDTYTWIYESTAVPIELLVVDGLEDLDGDGLTDFIELCESGSLPDAVDSDDDCIDDFTESQGGLPDVDLDGDGLVDAVDDDDDGDGVPTCEEYYGEGDPDPSAQDTDEDDTPDYLDDDDDGDGITSRDEDLDDNGDPRDDDSDGDEIPNYLDANDQDGPLGDLDDDGVINRDDNCVEVPNPDQVDLDMDDIGDACDDDVSVSDGGVRDAGFDTVELEEEPEEGCGGCRHAPAQVPRGLVAALLVALLAVGWRARRRARPGETSP